MCNNGISALLKSCILKKRGIRLQEGVSLPPCPTPDKIFIGRVQFRDWKKILEI
jgi:hypothetical protein